MEIDFQMMLKEFLRQLESLDEGSISLDALLINKRDKAVYEKWIEIFNVMNPMNIVQGLSTINSTFKMSKRDEIILLAYIKFFEQKISMLGSLPKELMEMFKKENDKEGKEERINKYEGQEFG
jgi:aspartate 1-decarboxylase